MKKLGALVVAVMLTGQFAFASYTYIGPLAITTLVLLLTKDVDQAAVIEAKEYKMGSSVMSDLLLGEVENIRMTAAALADEGDDSAGAIANLSDDEIVDQILSKLE